MNQNPQRTLIVVAVGALVVLTLCTLAGGLPILLAFLKWGWGVIALIVSVGGLVGLCCIVFIVLAAVGFLAFKLDFIKGPDSAPKKSRPSAPEKKGDPQ